MNIYIFSALSFLIAFVATPLTIRLAKKYRLVTDASKPTHPAHTHQGILPRAGGLPIFLAIFITSLPFVHNQIIATIIIGAALTVVVGLLDDKYNLSPYLRFFLNILSAIIAVAGGIGIPFITNPFDTVIHLTDFQFNLDLLGKAFTVYWLSDIAAVLWIVWSMNTINWSKGVDGQLPGFVSIAAFFLGILSLRFTRHDISQEVVTILCFTTSFAFLGFLPWNKYPQKILPGYAAGSLAGYMLAILSILSWGKLGTLMLILALPMTDAVLVFWRRVIKKKSPFKADRSHFHHTLLELGWSRKRIAMFYWAVSIIIGFFSLTMNSEEKMFAFFLLIFVSSGIVLGSYQFVKILKKETE
jgi:UDP-GlcNAc:undecaprenyl-phosphate GlcNAc-1-phosphate transferase